jgi:hypothetical protein
MDSNLPPDQSQIPPQITPQQLEEMKALARQQAIQQTYAQQQRVEQQPEIVYVRRNLTVAEVIAVFIISCSLVFGVQLSWNFVTNVLPRIEVKVN